MNIRGGNNPQNETVLQNFESQFLTVCKMYKKSHFSAEPGSQSIEICMKKSQAQNSNARVLLLFFSNPDLQSWQVMDLQFTTLILL